MTKQWRLTNTVNVDLSTSSTYFCVVGFTPGGYAGIQEISPGNKVAIFSFWNDGSDSVSLIEQGAGVTVSTFGGEGTGLKSMKDFDWEVETDVTFTVVGRNVGPAPSGSGKNIWRVACFYMYKNSGTWNFMAEYERTGADPVGTGGFYSFVEDWDRSNGAEGNLIQRRATFKNPMINDYDITDVSFTKVTTGDDEFAQWKAFSEQPRNGHVPISTGGHMIINDQIYQEYGSSFEL